jgi:hypothetical protein
MSRYSRIIIFAFAFFVVAEYASADCMNCECCFLSGTASCTESCQTVFGAGYAGVCADPSSTNPASCCSCYSECIPGSVSGCMFCNSSGTDWLDDDSRCPAGQNCLDGQCWKFFNVKDYGAAGDGAADDTDAVQSAVDDASNYGQGNIVLIPRGTYMIEAWDWNIVTADWTDMYKGVQLKNNTNIRLVDGAILRAIPSNSTNYCVIKIWGAHNVSISGGTVEGERDEHVIADPARPGEWGMGIDIRHSSMVSVSDMTFKDAWGDGIYISGTQTGAWNRNVVIKNVVCDNNRRQGVSLEDGENILIENAVLKNTDGTSPQFGIDIEPYLDYQRLKNIRLRNITTSNNKGGGVLLTTCSYARIFGVGGFYVSITDHTSWNETGSTYGPFVNWIGSGNPNQTGILFYNGYRTEYGCSAGCFEPACDMDGVCDTGEDYGNCPIDCCLGECDTYGARECYGDSYRTCGSYDLDPCLEWSGFTGCAPSQVCMNGDCVTTTSTTISPTTSKSPITSSTTTSTTLPEECAMPGNGPPCGVVELSEVVAAINQWAAGTFELGDLINLINSWADPAGHPPV